MNTKITIGLLLAMAPFKLLAQVFEYSTTPTMLFEDQEYTISIDIRYDIGCPDLRLVSTIENDQTHLNIDGAGTCLGLSPAIHTMYRLSTTLSAANPQHHHVFFRGRHVPLHFNPVSARGFRKVGHESPASDELVSGISLIRGWACQETGGIGTIKYQIDDGDIAPLPYGSVRADTESTCSTTSNIVPRGVNHGYGGIVNWNIYPAGIHRFRLWVDGALTTDHEFEIAKTKAAFQKGLSAETTVENFPTQNSSSVLRWSEADQNFILVNIQSD